MDIGGLHDEGALAGDIGYIGKYGKKGGGKNGKYDKGKGKYGKFKDKNGKGQKGKKGEKKGNDKSGKGKDKPEWFSGMCGYCWKVGHKRADCRKRLADLAKKGNGGKGDAAGDCGGVHLEDEEDRTLFGTVYGTELEETYEMQDWNNPGASSAGLVCFGIHKEEENFAKGTIGQIASRSDNDTYWISWDSGADAHVAPRWFAGDEALEDSRAKLNDINGGKLNILGMRTVTTVPEECEESTGPGMMVNQTKYNIGDKFTKPVNSVGMAYRMGIKTVLDPSTGECYWEAGGKRVKLHLRNNTFYYCAKIKRTTVAGVIAAAEAERAESGGLGPAMASLQRVLDGPDGGMVRTSSNPNYAAGHPLPATSLGVVEEQETPEIKNARKSMEGELNKLKRLHD